jgi:hypothetical protein
LIIDPVLVYSTLLGGGGINVSGGITVDDLGSAYVAGQTSSADFPALGSTSHTPCVLGGSGNDWGYGVAVDEAGNVYLCGTTSSADFPIVRPLQAALRGTDDAFVAKLDASGSRLVYSTYLGGTGIHDGALRIAIDGAGNVYVTGDTVGFDFGTFNFAVFVSKIADSACPD